MLKNAGIFRMRPELRDLPEAWPGEPSWFWHGEQILDLLEHYRPMVCVELGTWRGGSAIPMVKMLRQWGGVLTCVDLWNFHDGQPLWYHDGRVTIGECAQNMVNAGVSAHVRLLQARTDKAAAGWGGPIDFLYVDADHSYEGCLSDLESWWPHVKIGGLIAGDDYDDPRHGVTQAWDEFEKKYGQAFERRTTPGSNPACTRLIWGIKR